MTRRPSLLLTAALAVSSCTLTQLKLEGLACDREHPDKPCLDGYVCDASTNTCVRHENATCIVGESCDPSGGDASPGDADGGDPVDTNASETYELVGRVTQQAGVTMIDGAGVYALRGNIVWVGGPTRFEVQP